MTDKVVVQGPSLYMPEGDLRITERVERLQSCIVKVALPSESPAHFLRSASDGDDYSEGALFPHRRRNMIEAGKLFDTRELLSKRHDRLVQDSLRREACPHVHTVGEMCFLPFCGTGCVD